MANILCFDFGINHVGLAVGAKELQLSRALKALKAKDGKVDSLVLDKLFKEYKPSLIVVGLPLNMDGTYQDITFRAKKFGNRLANDYKVQVEFVDERLSTADAKSYLFENYGFKGLKDKGLVDSMSAVVILDTYFGLV